MSDNSSIEWCDATWNFLVGCTKVSAGCASCYAIRTVSRLATFPHNGAAYDGLTTKLPVLNWTGSLASFENRLDQPLRWPKPRRIFVNSMSDLFHKNVPDDLIDRAFAIMALTPRHTYQILTKRPERMAEYVRGLYESNFDTMRGAFDATISEYGSGVLGQDFRNTYKPTWFAGQYGDEGRCEIRPGFEVDLPIPLPNVWLGTSTEDQQTADERIPHLLNTPAAVRFLSMEPLLGPVILGQWQPEGVYIDWLKGFDGSDPPVPGLDWVIVGGESGPKARPMAPQWARDLRDQCVAAGVPYFFKQVGGRTPKAAGRLLDGVEWSQFPKGVTHVSTQ